MIGKRLINTGVAAADALVPSENFNTVLYTGNGSTQRIGGYINRGGVFNGSSSYIDTSVSVLPATDYSVSMWVLHNSLKDGCALYTQYRGSVTGRHIVNSNSNGTIQINTSSTNSLASITATPFTTGVWQHLVVTKSSSAGYIVYVDGSSIGTWSSTESIITDQSTQFGGDTEWSGDHWLDGKIDQIRIFNKALSSSEVTTLYGETHASTTISTTDIFSDNSGVALYQLDGNANDTGGVSGKFGSAAIFNGSSSKITSSVPKSSDQSFSFWTNHGSQSNSTATYFGYSNSASNGFFAVQVSSGNISILYWNGSTYARNTSSTSLTDGNWHHVVVTTSGNVFNIYVDGNTTPAYTTTLSGFTHASRSDLQISYETPDGSSSYFNGKIDDVRIYSDVLTSTEVGYLYNNTTASIPTDNLVAYYKLDGDARDEQQLYDGTATNVTYAYDGTATNVTYQEATKFTPDLVWIKDRDTNYAHQLYDTVRGATEKLHANTTAAEATDSTGLTAFTEGGFTISTNVGINTSGNDYVAWCFKGGGADVLNENGSIDSQVSANQDAGFSIVKYTGTGSNTNFGHGLSQPPELTIIKNLDDGTRDWIVHPSSQGNDKYLILNGTNAINTSSIRIQSVNSTVVNIGTNTEVNANGQDFICYNFHSVDDYSKIGSYQGTGTTNGNFVETGFEPAFVMVKRTDGGAQNWVMFDNKRSTTNPRTKKLAANLSSDENNSGTIGTDAQDNLDFYADGFRPVTSNNHTNISGGTFIYLAIAADPDTTTPTVEDSFDVVTYTGTGAAQDIYTDFKPDLVWIKNRTGSADHHSLIDSVRGIGSQIFSNLTNAENTFTDQLTSFNSNGFTIQGFTGAEQGRLVNVSGNDYVAWCWKAGDHDDNLPQINTEGSIDSVVSVNAESGFSIVKYTGNGTVGATIGHGLSSAPELTIIKKLDTVGYSGGNWVVGCGSYNTDLYLNSTAAAGTINYFWNAAPTSTVVQLKNDWFVNYNGSEYIMYNFHSVIGYQKIGSFSYSVGYSENVGFEPRFLLMKNTSTTGSWYMIDNKRVSGTNNYGILANSSAAEDTGTDYITFTSTGFTTTYSDSGTYIYLAIK